MYSKEQRQIRIATGLCGTCGKENPSPKAECENCRGKRKTEYQKSKASNNCKKKQTRETALAKGLCGRCFKNPTSGKATCDLCLERHRELERLAKDQVFEAYGGYKCSCCGETIKEFLTLDHINNDGAAHRREVFGGREHGSGRSLYGWIIRNNFPPILQVLCANCNWGKRMNGGICPHTTNFATVDLEVLV